MTRASQGKGDRKGRPGSSSGPGGVSPQGTADPNLAEVSPHAPELGWSRRLLGRFHFTGIFWYRFHQWGVCLLPSWAVGVFVVLFTTLFFFLLVKVRRAVASNLEAVLGRCGFLRRQVRVYRTLLALAWSLSERYERLATDRRFEVDIDLERWRALFSSSRGFLMVTAHIGNYEIGSMLPAFEEQRQVVVVREREIDDQSQAFLKGLLDKAGGARYVSHFGSDDPFHAVYLLETLRNGGIVGIQGDRPRAGGRTVEGTLFGRPFTFPAGPAGLARTAEVPMVPILVIRRGRRHYTVEIGDAIHIQRTRSRQDDIAEATRRVGVAIERAIRRTPHQWFCFRQLWKEEPAQRTRASVR